MFIIIFLLCLLFYLFPFYQISKTCFIFDIDISYNASLFFNSLCNDEHSNLLIATALPNSPFSGKLSSSVKVHIYQHFLMRKMKSQLFVFLNCIELCFVIEIIIDFFYFLTNSQFVIGSSYLISLNKNASDSLV